MECRGHARILAVVSLYTINGEALPELDGPVLIGAFDGWVDAGSAATAAMAPVTESSTVIATFDSDALFDYRSRRPTLDIVDGRLDSLTWPELAVRHARIGGRDLLVIAGPEPDDRWRAFAADLIELARRLGVTEWISLGAIPAAVPHTRDVPIIGTASEPGRLQGGILPGPAGHLRVPGACISVLEMAMADHGIPAVGYFAQVPHYVSGPYPAAAVALGTALGDHLGVRLPTGDLVDDAQALRTRLDTATALEETTRTYVERLEGMVDEQRLPSGDDLITEIERFLREGGTEGRTPS